MKAICPAMLLLLVAAGAQAQLLEPVPPRVWKAEPSAPHGFPTFPAFHAGSQGLPPADPLAPDIYRAAPKLFAGVDFNPYTGIEMSFTNPDYYEGMRFNGFGPRRAESIPLGVGGFNVDVAARLSIPVDDRLGVFGKLGVSAIERKQFSLAPVASVGATYKLNSRQTATAEIPFGSVARKVLTGAPGAFGGSVKLGF